MAFDYYSQLQGPVISTSLFPDAAQAGANTGLKVPTSTTAIVRGIQEGVDRGVQDVTNLQQIQLRQNEIEQLPTTNRIRQEQLENAQITNDINSIKLDIAKETQTEQLQATKEELLNQASDLNRKRELREKEKQLLAQAANADPLTTKKLINSGQYADVFANNPNVYKQLITPIYPYLNEQERHAVDYNLKRATTSNFYDKKAMERAPLFKTAQDALLNDDGIGEASRNAKLSPEDVATRGQFVPAGKYQTDDYGNVILGEDKQPLIAEDYDSTVKPSAYDVIVGDIRTGKGKVVASGVPEESKKLRDKYIYEKNWQTGANKQYALGRVNQEARSKDPSITKAAPTQEPPTVNEQTKEPIPDVNAPAKIPDIPLGKNIVVSSNTLAIQNVASTLGLPVETAAPKIQEFLQSVEEAPEGVFGRYSEDQINRKEAVIEELSIEAAKNEYQVNPTIKGSFTEKDVEQHNKIVKTILDNKFRYRETGESSVDLIAGFEARAANLNPAELVVVKSPEDLYVLKRKGVFDAQLRKSFTMYRKKIELTKQALLKAGTRGSRLASLMNQ